MNNLNEFLISEKNDILDTFNYLLLQEKIINRKKELGIKLDFMEYFYDNYIVSPKVILKMLGGIYEKNKK